MEKPKVKDPLKNILECIQSPQKEITTGSVYIPILLNQQPGEYRDQEERLKNAVKHMLKKHIEELRNQYFSPDEVVAYEHLSAKNRLTQDFVSDNPSLQNASLSWAVYMDRLTYIQIQNLCSIGLRLVQKKTSIACAELANYIRSEHVKALTTGSVVSADTKEQVSTAREGTYRPDGEQSTVQPVNGQKKSSVRVTPERLKMEIRDRGQFISAERLSLNNNVKQYREGFDFLGIQWTSMFAFTIGLVEADDMGEEEIKAICTRFSQFNNHLYQKPSGLGIPFHMYWLTFTLSGILCLLYKKDVPPEIKNVLDRIQRPSPAYAKGLDNLFWVQTSATSLYWAVDLSTQHIYKHQGKKPDRSNMHARWTVEHENWLEQSLSQPREVVDFVD